MLVPSRPPPPALIPVAASGGPAASVQIVCKNLQRHGKRPLLKLQQDVAGRPAAGVKVVVAGVKGGAAEPSKNIPF